MDNGTMTGTNTLHVLLTDEQEGYYADFTEQPTQRLARCLSQRFRLPGRGRPLRPAARRAQRPPAAGGMFVLFLQNHDQTGNRAPRRTPAGAVQPASATRRHHAAAALAHDPAAVHGR